MAMTAMVKETAYTPTNTKANYEGNLDAIDANFAKCAERVAVPASATAPGTVGQYAVDATHVYFCIATNVWVRGSVATWT